MTHTIEKAIEAYKAATGGSLQRVTVLIKAGYPSSMATDAAWMATKGIKTPQTQGNAYGAGRDCASQEKAMTRSHEYC